MKQFEYEQQIEHLKMSIDEIKDVLNNKPVSQWAYIIHDKDTDTAPHIHIMVKLANSDMTADNVCKWFKDEPQYINIKQSRWENKLAYLCHRTDTSREKYQYDPEDVVANFDYIKTLEKITNSVTSYKNIEDIIENIQSGIIREYNLTEYVDAHIFSKYKIRITNALEWYRRKVMTDKDRNIKVILFSGETGTGKTTFAKTFCKNAHKTFAISSSSNDPMQDYKGEDVLILDDIRDSTFKYHDLLKILDNHTNSTVQSRYNNKAFIGDTIILTSSKGIREWYTKTNNTDEDRRQLYRRIPEWYVFTKEYINIFHYDDNKCDYIYISRLPNILQLPVLKMADSMLQTLENLGFELSEEQKQNIVGKIDPNKRVIDDLKDNDDELPF